MRYIFMLKVRSGLKHWLALFCIYMKRIIRIAFKLSFHKIMLVTLNASPPVFSCVSSKCCEFDLEKCGKKKIGEGGRGQQWTFILLKFEPFCFSGFQHFLQRLGFISYHIILYYNIFPESIDLLPIITYQRQDDNQQKPHLGSHMQTVR